MIKTRRTSAKEEDGFFCFPVAYSPRFVHTLEVADKIRFGGVVVNEKYTEVLSQYDLHVTAVRRGRGSWICETSEGLKLLKEYKGTVKRIEFEDQVLEQVQKSGCLSVDRYVKNQEEGLVSSAEDGTRFIVKEWYADKECDLKNRQEIMTAVTELAKLHKILRNIEFKEEWNLGSILAQAPHLDMERHSKELRRARNFIRSKRHKTDFELCVISSFPLFYAQAEQARVGLNELWKTEEIPLFLCHGDLDQHHILMKNPGTAIIEYNKMHLGIQMTDLYRFMRKVMEKHDWNMNLGLDMLAAYDQKQPITQVERSCLYYLFLYPEKYWKQINFYFNANKAWIPDRNIEKLKNLEAQQESRERFLEGIK